MTWDLEEQDLEPLTCPFCGFEVEEELDSDMRYQKKQNTIVGIDYSLNSPAICIVDDDFDFNKCSFHFLTSKKKHIGKFGNNIFGYEIKEYNT